MYLSKLGIRNFRNFEAADIPLAGNDLPPVLDTTIS